MVLHFHYFEHSSAASPGGFRSKEIRGFAFYQISSKSSPAGDITSAEYSHQGINGGGAQGFNLTVNGCQRSEERRVGKECRL